MGVLLAVSKEVDLCARSLVEGGKTLTAASVLMRNFLPLLWQVMNISLPAASEATKENTTESFPPFPFPKDRHGAVCISWLSCQNHGGSSSIHLNICWELDCNS